MKIHRDFGWIVSIFFQSLYFDIAIYDSLRIMNLVLDQENNTFYLLNGANW